MKNSDISEKYKSIPPIFSNKSFYRMIKITVGFLSFNLVITVIDIIINDKKDINLFFLLSFLESGLFLVIGPLMAITEPYKSIQDDEDDKSKRRAEKKSEKALKSELNRKNINRIEASYYGKILVLTGLLLIVFSSLIDYLVSI